MLLSLLFILEVFFCAMSYSIFDKHGIVYLINSIPFYIIVIIPVFMYLWSRKNRKFKSSMFENWIIDHKHEIESGHATYQGIAVSPETKLVRYHVAISFILVSIRHPSPDLYIEGSSTEKRIRFGYTLFSLLFGWWGIIGPIFTIQVLYWNATKKHQLTAKQLIESTPSLELAEGRVSYQE